MSSLQAVATKHKSTAILTLNPRALGVVNQQAHSAAWLGTQHSPTLQDKLLGGEPLVPVVVCPAQQAKVVHVFYGGALAAHGTGDGIADLRVAQKVPLQQLRAQVVPEAVQAGDMAGGTGKHKHQVFDAETGETRHRMDVGLDEAEGSTEVPFPRRRMVGTLEEELGERRLAAIRVNARHFQALAVAADAIRAQHIGPVLGILENREGTTPANGATHT